MQFAPGKGGHLVLLVDRILASDVQQRHHGHRLFVVVRVHRPVRLLAGNNQVDVQNGGMGAAGGVGSFCPDLALVETDGEIFLDGEINAPRLTV